MPALLLVASCQLWQPPRPAPPPEPPPPPVTVSLTTMERRLLREVNAVRTAAGKTPLVNDEQMTEVAQLYATELAARRVLDHNSPTPGRKTMVDRLHAGNVYFTAAAENLAQLSGVADEIPARAVAMWRQSPGHNRNMMDARYYRSGIGVSRAVDYTWYIVQVYAGPR